MGRVRPSHIKKSARTLLNRYPDKFSHDFKENRHNVDELVEAKSKTIKNRIAGYITTSIKQEK